MGQFLGRDGFIGGKDAYGKREVVGRTFFTNICRCHVDDYIAGGHFVPGHLQGGDDTLMALFYGRVGQTYQIEHATS